MDPLITSNSLLDGDRLEFLRSKAIEVAALDGDVCEVGVYKGGSALLLCEAAGPNGHVFLIDTFSGMPRESAHDNHHREGDFGDTSMAYVRQVLAGQRNYSLLRQVFPADTALLEQRRFKLVHIDADLYESYAACLEFFFPRLAPGGYLILDDYGATSCLGAKRATDEFVAKHGLTLHHGASCQYYLQA